MDEKVYCHQVLKRKLKLLFGFELQPPIPYTFLNRIIFVKF
jgi:hypothetical protein